MATESVHVIGTKEHLDEALASAPTSVSERAYGRKDYRVNIPSFEGPLDLLLHLIRKDQIDIDHIPIAQICQSYLEYIEIMEKPDVNLAGEFLVMASTLMYLKSITLLPKNEDEEQDDPRRPLVAQLLEYERFQRAAKILEQRPWLRREVYPRPASAYRDLIPAESLLNAAVEPVDMYRLLVALKTATDRTTRPALEVETDPVSLREKVTQIGSALEVEDVVELSTVVPWQMVQKQEIIIAFLSILELARLGFVEIIQRENFGPIHVKKIRALSELNVSMLDQF